MNFERDPSPAEPSGETLTLDNIGSLMKKKKSLMEQTQLNYVQIPKPHKLEGNICMLFYALYDLLCINRLVIYYP